MVIFVNIFVILSGLLLCVSKCCINYRKKSIHNDEERPLKGGKIRHLGIPRGRKQKKGSREKKPQKESASQISYESSFGSNANRDENSVNNSSLKGKTSTNELSNASNNYCYDMQNTSPPKPAPLMSNIWVYDESAPEESHIWNSQYPVSDFVWANYYNDYFSHYYNYPKSSDDDRMQEAKEFVGRLYSLYDLAEEDVKINLGDNEKRQFSDEGSHYICSQLHPQSESLLPKVVHSEINNSNVLVSAEDVKIPQEKLGKCFENVERSNSSGEQHLLKRQQKNYDIHDASKKKSPNFPSDEIYYGSECDFYNASSSVNTRKLMPLAMLQGVTPHPKRDIDFRTAHPADYQEMKNQKQLLEELMVKMELPDSCLRETDKDEFRKCYRNLADTLDSLERN